MNNQIYAIFHLSLFRALYSVFGISVSQLQVRFLSCISFGCWLYAYGHPAMSQCPVRLLLSPLLSGLPVYACIS